jgi:hypothetical protein
MVHNIAPHISLFHSHITQASLTRSLAHSLTISCQLTHYYAASSHTHSQSAGAMKNMSKREQVLAMKTIEARRVKNESLGASGKLPVSE